MSFFPPFAVSPVDVVVVYVKELETHVTEVLISGAGGTRGWGRLRNPRRTDHTLRAETSAI